MSENELMAIGRFARISGLSIHALRHYDDVGLLAPAEVDPTSGYRRYGRGQLRIARLIRSLRWIDLPIDEIRQILRDGDGERVHAVFARHRQRLERQGSYLSAQIRDTDRYLEKGITMPTTRTGCRPVQIKIAVDDAQASIAFYQEAFGLRYDVTRRTDEEDYSSFVFGEYGEEGFFLLHFIDDPADIDRPGSTMFGLLVDDLDAFHARAVTAGASEVVASRDLQGMPRCSAIRDPSGNTIWLYQS